MDPEEIAHLEQAAERIEATSKLASARAAEAKVHGESTVSARESDRAAFWKVTAQLIRKAAKPGRSKKAAESLPTSPEAIAASNMFSRKLSTHWTAKEVASFRELRRRGVLTVESMELIGRYYAAERAKGDDGHHRRDLPTFLNNFDGELDRATQSRAGREVRKAKAAPIEPEGWREALLSIYPTANVPKSFYALPDDIQTEVLDRLKK